MFTYNSVVKRVQETPANALSMRRLLPQRVSFGSMAAVL